MRYFPLYEAKMFHQFDHRWATFAADGPPSDADDPEPSSDEEPSEAGGDRTRECSLEEKQDPLYLPTPRYWVSEADVLLRAVPLSREEKKELERLDPEEVVRRLLSLRADIEGNREAWEHLKGLKTIFVEAERRERNLRLLDAQRPEANRFHVTDEFPFQSGARRIRADVVFLVNGIPVIVVETKAATHLEGIAEALDQIRRYHAEAPDLMAQAQLFALTHLIQFFYGATWSLSRKTLFNWREEVGTNRRLRDPGQILRRPAPRAARADGLHSFRP
jgi:hypothetical protein